MSDIYQRMKEAEQKAQQLEERVTKLEKEFNEAITLTEMNEAILRLNALWSKQWGKSDEEA